VDDEFIAKKDAETRLFSIATKKEKKVNPTCQSNDKLRTSSHFFSSEIPAEKISEKIECILMHNEACTSSPTTTSEPQLDNVCLAKSYTNFSGKAQDILWKLHLRHGHKNFADIARQYDLPLPATIPACSSCVMGKSHSHPHLGGNFDRAVRVGQGFHADFKGSTGYLALYQKNCQARCRAVVRWWL